MLVLLHTSHTHITHTHQQEAYRDSDDEYDDQHGQVEDARVTTFLVEHFLALGAGADEEEGCEDGDEVAYYVEGGEGSDSVLGAFKEHENALYYSNDTNK